MPDAEKIMQGLARLAVESPGFDGLISDAIALIERLTPRPIAPGSDEGFAIRSLRTAAERNDMILISSKCESFMAWLHSDAMLRLLGKLEQKEAARA